MTKNKEESLDRSLKSLAHVTTITTIWICNPKENRPPKVQRDRLRDADFRIRLGDIMPGFKLIQGRAM